MMWRIRWVLADKLEGWARRLRPQIPAAPETYEVRMRWPDMPPGRPLAETIRDLTGEQ